MENGTKAGGDETRQLAAYTAALKRVSDELDMLKQMAGGHHSRQNALEELHARAYGEYCRAQRSLLLADPRAGALFNEPGFGNGWIAMAARMPTKEDADIYDCVLVYDRLNGTKVTGWQNTFELLREPVTHWRRCPPNPQA